MDSFDNLLCSLKRLSGGGVDSVVSATDDTECHATKRRCWKHGTRPGDDMPMREEWEMAIGRLAGNSPADSYAHAITAIGLSYPSKLGRFSPSQRPQAAEASLQAIASFLVKEGGDDIPRSSVAKAQENLRAFPELVNKYPEFFEESFYEDAIGYHRRIQQESAIRDREIKKIIHDADMADQEGAKRVLESLESAVAKYGETQQLRDTRALLEALAKGKISEPKKEKVKLTDPVFPATLDELTELPTPDKMRKGFTAPKLLIDRTGKKWVLKQGGSEGHALAEYESSQAYRQLGIRAPASRMYGAQRLSEYIEGRELGEFMSSATPEEKKRVVEELREGFPADVVLGNHDLIGDDEDNVMIGEDGHVWRVDCGGSLGRKGAGDADESFSDGWIDDLWTMRGMSPTFNFTKAPPKNDKLVKYFGNMGTHEILSAAVKLPWDKAIAHMEESRFQKPNGDKKAKGQSVRVTKGRKEIMQERLREIRALHSVSKSVVEDGHYMPQYNDGLLKLVYSLMKTPFREISSMKGKNGSSILYDNTELGIGLVRRGMPGATFKSVHADSNLESEKIRTSASLDGILKDTARRNGISLSRTDKMFKAHGRDSNQLEAAKLKVIELHNLGYDLKTIATGGVPDLSPHIAGKVALAANDYLEANPSQFADDSASAMMRKAGTMMFLQHSGLSNFDPRTNRLLCVRTESRDVMNHDRRNGIGTVAEAYPRDSHASYSWFQTASPYEDHYTIAVSVPLSRVTCCDLFTSEDGKNLFNQFNRNETEITVNALGLPYVYVGELPARTPISQLYPKIAEAEARSGRTLAGERFNAADEYIRLAAPWARATAMNNKLSGE